MLKKSAQITIIFVVSTFIQLISQIVVTRTFGAKIDLDIFLAAVALPTIIVTVIYGTLNDAFLPLYAESKIKNPEKSDQYFFSHFLLLTLVSLPLTCAFYFLSQPISHLLYSVRGIEFVKNVAFQMKYLFFSIPFSVIATIFGTYYYSHKKFIRFPFAQAMGSVINLLLIIFLSSYIGIFSLVVAFVINIIFQIFLVIPPKSIFSFKEIKLPAFNKINTVFLAWLPLVIGTFALRSDSILIRSFGSQLTPGYLVYLNLISKIFSLATGVMTIGIQIVLLPHLVEEIARKNYQKMVSKINRAKIISLVVSSLVVAVIIITSPVIIRFLFVGGKFTLQDSQKVIYLLPYFILPGIGWGIANIFFQPLLALKKTWTVGIINIISLIFGWLIAFFINKFQSPIEAISWGLITLLFMNIILAEIVWQCTKKNYAEQK